MSQNIFIRIFTTIIAIIFSTLMYNLYQLQGMSLFSNWGFWLLVIFVVVRFFKAILLMKS
jgi:hypothetical protein